MSTVRLGSQEGGAKEVSQLKTEAMRVAWRLTATKSTEAEYSMELDHECEFRGERESGIH